jgi:hypothetical protein
MQNQSPYKPPKSALLGVEDSEASRKGRYVVFKPDIEWPSRCFKCNKETDQKKEVKLTYVNPWIYVSILFTILLTIILALIFQKKFKVSLPLCENHLKKRKNFLIFQWTMVAVMTAGILAGILANLDVLFIVSIFVFIVIVISAIFGRLVFAAKYKNGNLWVTGGGKPFLNSLSDFNP